MKTPRGPTRAVHLNRNISGAAGRFQIYESLTLHLLTGESSVFILQHEFRGSSL